MDKKNIIPQQAQPVVRVSQGTQADLLAELSEETLASTPGAGASMKTNDMTLACYCVCSYDGDDAE
ncbi:bacteriocin leader peptide, microcyclamide/patellamide family [Rivularia sp. PCC 7116]|uniref:DUF5837 family cyanobactin class RiPP n=1 Tax=Rivularia sp. PCC 7116 TaxID=373994 RepID=UPI00029EFC20|nr:DUF5837 family cyanobactin class RiPP [Rivularia sp. PCC 7116]AFY58678.1 bacteriocin leader peptide, microcyclamide/patellamide family [Rivularia sp. PCC 7116]